jgi:hypothetical protein
MPSSRIPFFQVCCPACNHPILMSNALSMLDPATLRAIAIARLDDAQILLANARYDGASYICGYVVEFTLKARICDTLNWNGYPETRNDFQNLQTFKTHNLDILLSLSGREQIIKQGHYQDWSIVNQWNPEVRYRDVGHVSPVAAQSYLQAVIVLIPYL